MKKNSVKISKLKNSDIKWIISISVLAFFISLSLSIMSQSILNHKNIIIALILLLTFLFLNVISDMIGLAITSCKIENVMKITTDDKIIKITNRLIKNSDKVSSVLCDVVGDICGILCGVSGSIFSLMLSSIFSLNSLDVIIGAVISAFVAGITVLLKAISKNYAVSHSSKLVCKISKLLSKFLK